MKLPFRQEEFLGNIRSGKRRENNLPCNIDHFNVHYDSYTSEYSMELFESVYKEKTDKLLIIPVTNMIITNEVYKKDVKCKGIEGKNAIRTNDKGEQVEVNCNPDTCEHALKGKIKCKKIGRIYFRLVGIENKGVWCYTTGSKRMDHIKKYLNLMVEKGIDITKNEFLLTLNETMGSLGGKVYAPDIKIANKNNANKTNENQPVKQDEKEVTMENHQKQTKQQNLKTNNQEQRKIQKLGNLNQMKIKNLYKYIEGKMVEYKSQKLPRVVFTDKEGKENVFFMAKTSKSEILNLGVGTEIEILKVSENKANDRFLMDYNVITKIEKNKKVV